MASYKEYREKQIREYQETITEMKTLGYTEQEIEEWESNNQITTSIYEN